MHQLNSCCLGWSPAHLMLSCKKSANKRSMFLLILSGSMDRTWRIICDVAGNQNARNIPSSGLRDTQSRGIKLDTTFPRVSFPPPPGMVGQRPVEVRTIFVIGNSNARAITVDAENLTGGGERRVDSESYFFCPHLFFFYISQFFSSVKDWGSFFPPFFPLLLSFLIYIL